MKILNWAIYLIVFCLPLYLVRFNIFNTPTTALELMIYGLFLFWLAKKGYKNLPLFVQENKLLFLGIILLLIGAAIATIFSWDLKVSAGILKAWFIDPLLFFAVFITTIKKKDINGVFYALILSGFVVAAIALVYLIQGHLNYQGRLQGIYDSPNYLAMYLAPILIICLGFIVRIYLPKDTRRSNCDRNALGLGPTAVGPAKRSLWQINLLVGNFLLLLVILFFTESFGVLLGIFGAMVFGLIMYLYKKNKKIVILGVIIIAFAVIFIFGLIKIKTLEGSKSFDARFVIWQKAWQVFKSYPLIGIGPGTFQDYFPPYPKWGVPQPHNVFLAFLIQTGIIGFIGFVLILLWFFRSRAGQLWVDNTRMLLMIIISYFLIHGLVDTTYWKNDLSLLFWLIIAMMVVIKKEP